MEKKKNKSTIIQDQIICFATIKSGLRKGMVCVRTNCKYHKNVTNNEPSQTCQAIIKSGIKKGMVCGRTNCKYHKPIININV